MRRIPVSKFNMIVVLLLCSIVDFFLTIHFVNGVRSYTSQEITFISWIAIIELVTVMICWRKMTNEILSPFVMVILASILFGMGQIFGWAFKLDMDYLDLQTYIPAIGMHYVGDSLIYSLDGIILFILGGAISYTGKNRASINLEDTEKNEIDKIAIKTVSTLLLIVSIPAFIINIWNVLPAVLTGGYSELYTELNSYSQAGQFIPLLAGWLPIALLMKYALYNTTRKDYSNAAVIGIGVYIVINLFLGARSGAVMLALAFIITKQYLGTPFTKNKVIPVGIAGYFGMGILNAVKDVRLMANRNLMSVLGAFSLSSVIGSFLGELGWSMSSLSWTMRLLDNGSYYRHGESYLYAFTAIIPNLGFWTEHPAVKANLGHWMQSSLGRTTGLGYTFIAETYANFAWGGLIMMFIFGFILGKIMTSVTRDTAKYNYKATLILVMIISILLKSFVRSSFSAIMRQLVFTVILIAVLIDQVGKSYHRRKQGSIKA